MRAASDAQQKLERADGAQRGEDVCYSWAKTPATHIYSQTHSYVLFIVPSATYDEGLLLGHVQNGVLARWQIIKCY